MRMDMRGFFWHPVTSIIILISNILIALRAVFKPIKNQPTMGEFGYLIFGKDVLASLLMAFRLANDGHSILIFFDNSSPLSEAQFIRYQYVSPNILLKICDEFQLPRELTEHPESLVNAILERLSALKDRRHQHLVMVASPCLDIIALKPKVPLLAQATYKSSPAIGNKLMSMVYQNATILKIENHHTTAFLRFARVIITSNCMTTFPWITSDTLNVKISPNAQSEDLELSCVDENQRLIDLGLP